MTGAGAPDQRPIDCHDLRVAILAASWHQTVMDGLVEGAQRACRDYKVEAPHLVRVPGTFELPVVADALAAQGYDAVVALGVVIRGATPHFDLVVGQATSGVAQIAAEGKLAIGYGVLACENMEQAIERAGSKSGNRGFDAAMVAVEMANLYAALADAPPSAKGSRKAR